MIRRCLKLSYLYVLQCDLQAQRQVEQMEIETFYKQHNFIGWTETSPKEGLMVNDSMRYVNTLAALT